MGLALAGAAAGGVILYQRAADRAATLATAPIRVRRSVTIDRPAAEVYQSVRQFENLPRLLGHLESAQEVADGHYRWRVEAPGVGGVEWEEVLTDDRPNEVIAWRSVEDALVPNEGSVRFTATGPERTELRLSFTYFPPGGRLGAGIAKLFGREPSQQADEGLRRLKQELETGSTITTAYARPSARQDDEGSEPATVTALRRAN
jgi:uncharacterized membrane protein